MRMTLVVACMLLWGCASSIPELWPPASGAPPYPIYVSLDTWHAMIAFPINTEAGSELPTASRATPSTAIPLEGEGTGGGKFEEWGYAERAWYLENRQGLSGVLRALFWPTEGVVEVGQYDQVWADRTPQPPSDLFVFRVSEEGYRRMRRHLRSTIASVESVAPVGSATFYVAGRSYHLFHTCHQYAARALQEAGMPVSPLWAFNRGSLAIQLRRAVRLAAEQAPGS